jgi:hypothetical protein
MLGKKDEKGDAKPNPAAHPVTTEANDVLNEVKREWGILETRMEALYALTPESPKVEIKTALSKVKRASMDVRDALKKVGKISL